MIVSTENPYSTSLRELHDIFGQPQKRKMEFDELVSILTPIFDLIARAIESKKDVIGEDTEEFAQALCFDTCVSILDSANLGRLILDLPLVSRYIAGEAAVAYSIGGVVDALDPEHKVKRITAAFMVTLAYLFASEKNGSP
ncbi:MAG: hypothetical protein ACW98Y_10980 [Candidatus Thorarchaeota archaeon]|jgi:hypothetical protein